MTTPPPANAPYASGPLPGAPTAGQKQPGKGLKKAGKILAWIGGIVLVIAVVVGAIMAVLGFRNVSTTMDQAERFQGEIEISATEGESLQLYADSEASTPFSCDVVGADGTPPGSGTNQNSSITYDGVNWESFASFTPESTQNYLITCDDPQADVLVAPPVSIGGIFSGVGGILIGIFAGGFGLFVLVLGLVLYFVGRGQANKAAQV